MDYVLDIELAIDKILISRLLQNAKNYL